MEELITTFSSWKTKLFAIIIYKGDLNLDTTQKNMKYNQDMFYKNVFLLQMMLSLTSLGWD